MNHDISHMTTSEYFAWNGKLASEGMEEKARQGIYPSAAPLGYLNREGRIVLDPIRAPLIAEAFRLDREGLSVRSILAIVTEKGLTSSRGKKLQPSALWRVLHNPFYAGEFVWKGCRIKADHPVLSTLTAHSRD